MPPWSASLIAAEPVAPEAVQPAPVRLLLLTDTTLENTGGSERFLRNLIERLPVDRYDVTVVQLGAREESDVQASLGASGRPLRLLGWPTAAIYGRSGRRTLRRLRDFVREGRFDIIQSQHEKSDLANAAARGAGACRHVSNRRDMGFMKNARLRLAFRLLNGRYDAVVAPAHEILGALARHERLGPGRMVWIPNGVDTAKFRPAASAGQRQAMRASLGLGPDEIAFGCVASLYPVKGHAVLLDAFARVHARNPRCRLLLVGSGELAGPLERQAQALGLGAAVTQLGIRADIDRILPALDVSVLASHSEGMSNAVLEAMASGLPVLATAVGGNLQLVRDGVTGCLVPAADVTEMATAMDRLAGDAGLREQLGAAGRRRIEAEFSLETMVRAYERLYQRLLEGPCH
ncbi:glycosyltransferase [Lysobacter sp. SG-8]|uniref:Glycosyltransferase n=2 Tax=Marilutibacter penaei TaxID=2759900 RepID=A0A7W3U1Y9_9GAMM|nr:glycosyltransferase [Lysobacter penaei]